MKFNQTILKWIGIIAIICILIPSVCVRCTFVDSSEIGIKFNKLSLTDQGKLDAITVSGYVFYCPLTHDVYTYETYMQSVDYDAFKVKTKDGSRFEIDPKLNYHLRRELAVDVFANFRRPLKYIEEKYMMNAVYDAYRITADAYTADSLIANQAKFEDEVKSMLDSTLTRVGFYIDQFTSMINPPESLKKIIDEKNAAVQSALKAENEVKTAEADAKIAVAKAEGAAKAMRVKADAEAYYNRTIAASLSERIVQEDFLEKWDGKMPTYFYIAEKGGANIMSILPSSN